MRSLLPARSPELFGPAMNLPPLIITRSAPLERYLLRFFLGGSSEAASTITGASCEWAISTTFARGRRLSEVLSVK